MIELKPCPFCGGEAEYVYRSGILIAALRPVAVKCKECGAVTADVDASTEYCAKDKAVELWNRRIDNVCLMVKNKAELVRCRDCKHYYNDADTGMACDFTSMSQPEDGFCNWAEKKTRSKPRC